MSLTEDSEPPINFRKWVAISTVASALQRKIKFELGLSITIYPNLYVVLVGPPATGKGTAMGFAEDIINKVPSIKISAQATSLQALIKNLKETNLTDLNKETGGMIFHSSLTVFSNEFTVFLGYHNSELIATLCDWFDCKEKWTYDTIKRGKEEIRGVWVNILAGTTHESLQASFPMEAIGGGLSSRIIFVNEYKKGKDVILPNMTESQLTLQHCLIRDLEQISMLSGVYKTTENALGTYYDWCIRSINNPPFQDRKFDAYIGRRRVHLLSLAMICAASRSDKLIIEQQDMERSIQLIEEVEINMGTVFRGIGKSDISGILGDALAFFENSIDSNIPLHMFYRRFEGDVDKLMMDRMLNTLEQSNYIRVIKRPDMDTVIKILDKDKVDDSK
jgi:hypothetical protein